MLVGGAKRLYGIVEGGDLAYVEERVDADGGLVPHLSARLVAFRRLTAPPYPLSQTVFEADPENGAAPEP